VTILFIILWIHLPRGGSQLPPGFTISSGPLFLLLTALRGLITDPTPLPRFSDRYHCGYFLLDLLMLLYGLHEPWIRLTISVCRFVAGGRLIRLWPYGFYCGVHFASQYITLLDFVSSFSQLYDEESEDSTHLTVLCAMKAASFWWAGGWICWINRHFLSWNQRGSTAIGPQRDIARHRWRREEWLRS
jgi:hypothetical protein